MAKVSAAMEKQEREAMMQFFRYVLAMRPKDARVLFTKDCIAHNPYVAPNMDAVLESMEQVQQGEGKEMMADSQFDVMHVIVEGNMAAAYTTLQSKSDRSKGLRQVHLFRFIGDKIAEYWDVTQMAPESDYAHAMF